MINVQYFATDFFITAMGLEYNWCKRIKYTVEVGERK